MHDKGASMKHFSAEEWSDFVRGLSPPGEREGMRAHLDAGCTQCRETVEWLSEMVQIANSDSGESPSDDVVARAVAIFAAAEPRDWIERLQEIAAELIFDSSRDLQPAGVRAVASQNLRLVYRAGDYSLDLMFEPADSSFDIIGQVTHKSSDNEYVADVLVQLVAGAKALGETRTNQFGEFMIGHAKARNILLRIALKRSGEKIDLPLRYPN
jgi:hypothetical protein